MDTHSLVKKIQKKSWDLRVKRTGFLQSKIIVIEALLQPIELVKGVIASYDSQLWVGDISLYDQDQTNSFFLLFKEAFKKDSRWYERVLGDLENLTAKKDLSVKQFQIRLTNIASANKLFEEYRDLLHAIQKYYVIAVPLTNYCELVLKQQGFEFSPWATAYKKLDIDFYHDSLKKLGVSKENERAKLIDQHLREFAWIKTAYNIVEPYTEKDVLEALKSNHPDTIRLTLPVNCPPELIGLQAGIYIRNRMKELSQQIWYAFEPVGQYIAKSIGISKDDFFSLTPKEVEEALKTGRSPISEGIFEERRKVYVTGFFEKEFVLFTGKPAHEVLEFFDPEVSQTVSELRGSIACKGLIKGIVRVVKNKSQFGKFKAGEILVTSMTTPDFILLMKKASAIVTDEGGLSSHAAIVSRELNVPCIIGTKIATKILKDGDMVKVDANKGIVRIVSK